MDELRDIFGAADAKADLAHPSPAALLAVAETIGKGVAGVNRWPE